MRRFFALILFVALLQFSAFAQEVVEQKGKRLEFEIGGSVGLFAGTTALLGELRFALPHIIGPATTSFRVAGAYAQSEDSSRRYAPLCVDGILNFPAGWFTGVDNYLGAGVNYVVQTSGRKSGSFGTEVFYGVDGEGFGGRLFGELGYGYLNTGFGPSHQGMTVLVGYRRGWGF
jgi:hypothetical protein